MSGGSSILPEVTLWKPKHWRLYISGFFKKSKKKKKSAKQLLFTFICQLFKKKLVLHSLIFHMDRFTVKNRMIGYYLIHSQFTKEEKKKREEGRTLAIWSTICSQALRGGQHLPTPHAGT